MVLNWQLQGEGCIPNRNSTTTALHQTAFVPLPSAVPASLRAPSFTCRLQERD